MRFCLCCLHEFIGQRADPCIRCGSADTMGISCTAQEANERQAARKGKVA